MGQRWLGLLGVLVLAAPAAADNASLIPRRTVDVTLSLDGVPHTTCGGRGGQPPYVKDCDDVALEACGGEWAYGVPVDYAVKRDAYGRWAVATVTCRRFL
ncbi:MAG: hypothetical protein AAF318_14050 [Pseudomonadota bacterium]